MGRRPFLCGGWPSASMVAGATALGVQVRGHGTKRPAVRWFSSRNATPRGNLYAWDRCVSRVLLVEDELLVRELACEDLADAGFEVTPANDGDEALEILRGGATFDLLFTDIRMPGAIDGWDLAREARTMMPDLKVIYATGLGDAGDELLDGERYVRKPYNLKDLREVLGELGFADESAS